MKASIGASLEKKWKPIALLSIIVPLSLLLAVRFAGIVSQPLQPETTELETVAWNMTRPHGTVWPDKLISNLYVDEVVALNFSVYVGGYTENRGIPPYKGLDVIEQDICVNASVKKGFVVSLNIRFSQVEDDAYLDIIEDKVGFFVEERNVEITSWKDSRLTQYPSVEARAVGQPKDCYLYVTAFWTFMDNSTSDHSTTLTLRVTYFDGNAYKTIEAPILLEILI